MGRKEFGPMSPKFDVIDVMHICVSSGAPIMLALGEMFGDLGKMSAGCPFRFNHAFREFTLGIVLQAKSSPPFDLEG